MNIDTGELFKMDEGESLEDLSEKHNQNMSDLVEVMNCQLTEKEIKSGKVDFKTNLVLKNLATATKNQRKRLRKKRQYGNSYE